MNTTTLASNPAQTLVNDLYDPDEVVPTNSPLLQAQRPCLRLSPSPPPQIPLSQVSSPSSSDGRGKSNRRQKVKPSQGDAVLISYLDGGKNPQIAATAGIVALASDTSEDSNQDETGDSGEESDDNPNSYLFPGAGQAGGYRRAAPGDSVHEEDIAMSLGTTPPQGAEAVPPSHALQALAAGALGQSQNEPGRDAMALDPRLAANDDQPSGGSPGARTRVASPPAEAEAQSSALQAFAAGALGALSLHGPETAGDKEKQRPTNGEPHILKEKVQALEPPQKLPPTPREITKWDNQSISHGAPSPFSPSFSPRQALSPMNHMDIRSPGAGPLPPIQGMSPRSDTTNGQNLLPSIREQLGDIKSLTDHDRHGAGFSPTEMNRLGPMNHASPPISPNEAYRRGGLASPGHPLQAPSPGYPYYPPHMNGHRPDYNSSTTETPSTDHSASTPATSTSIADVHGALPDRMSIDGITNPQGGSFVCKVPGCGAPAFQTQYLLNSHANVHSSVRPHYCPVKGCPRSEGGKGFKRKNEMIRHGLVHDSPGYVCPFCPDREHKYPRPDNLQRHVRVHHVDKDKDDPALRDVLSQRPDGPNRGRRRRGGPA